METSLHRQLKAMYAASDSDQEVRLANFRIDAVVGGVLIEIQFGSLGAIRDKARILLESHRMLIVKPLAARKILVKRESAEGKTLSRRASPNKETLLSIFEHLVYFGGVFPHPNLTLEALLTEQEEHRIPPTTRRRRRKKHEVCERVLLAVNDRVTLRTNADLRRLLPATLPDPFTTAQLAEQAKVAKWQAQKIAYCLRETQAAVTVGKKGNAWLYQFAESAKAA